MALTAIGIAAIVLLLMIIVMYNGLVNKRNQLEYAWSNIDVQLKKRYDLIPNLVASVKEYMGHEKDLLEEIVRLRNAASADAVSRNDRLASENQLTQALGQLRVSVENYPELKSNENFIHLQRSLNEVESQLSASRRAYNGAVLSHNNAVQMFPTSIIASMMHMQLETPFEALPEERANTDVSDLFNKS